MDCGIFVITLFQIIFSISNSNSNFEKIGFSKMTLYDLRGGCAAPVWLTDCVLVRESGTEMIPKFPRLVKQMIAQKQ